MAAGPVELGSTGLFNDSSFVDYYKGESTADSKGSNTLTNNNSVAFNAAKFNNGADGGATNTNKSLSVASRLTIDGGACTFSFWVKLNTEIASGQWDLFMHSTNSAKVDTYVRYNYNAGTRRLEFYRNKPGGVGTQINYTITLGTSNWHHIVLTYDTTNLGGYVDGTSIGTSAASGSGSSNTSDALFILASTYSNNYSSAIIDDFGVFTRALTLAEALVLYQGGIAFDAASNSGYQATASSYNWTHTTLTAGDSRYLIVGVSLLSVGGASVSNITYNSINMTKIGSIASVSGAVRSELWGILAPSTGANSIAVTLSTGLISAACAISFTGVHQVSPLEGVNSASATNVGAADATVNVVTVATNDWVVDQIATDDATITVGAGQTSRNNVTGAGGSGADSTEPATTPATVTMSWTNVAALATWSTVATALRDINAASLASTPTRWRMLTGMGT